MKRKCDECDRPATHHSVEIVKGQKIEKHLCDQHAAEQGMTVSAVHAPINELLTNFVKLHSGAAEKKSADDLTCEDCGLSFKEFREASVLGCPGCYAAFEQPLGQMIERAHEGATHHLGKVPQHAGRDEHRSAQMLRLRKRLDQAVSSEDYELAAKLRDELRTLEEESV